MTSTDNVPQTPSRALNGAKVTGAAPQTPKTEYVVTPEDDEDAGESPDTGEYPEAIAYDEEVPVYWDMAAECYYYYGYPLAYDEDQESYYYYSHEDGDYLYIDQETLDLINADQIYSYNNDTGEYELPGGVEDDDGAAADKAEDDEAAAYDEVEEQDELAAAETAAEEGEEEEQEEEEEADEEVIEQVEPADEEGGVVEPATTTTAQDQGPLAAPMDMPAAGLYGMANLAEDPFANANGAGGSEMSPSMQAMLKHVMATSAAANNADKFPNSIDSFNDSYQNIANRGHKMLYEICSEDPSVLEEYKQRPNGSYVIGRCKRTVDGLIRGNLELKSLAPTEVSSVASILQNLSLPQLVYIRNNAQNSSWLKSPQVALKAFAEKCDHHIGEKLIHFMLARDVDSTNDSAAEERNKRLLKKLGPMDARQCGVWTVFCLGALSELSAAKERILGTDGLKAHWWWQTATSSTGGTMLKGDCDENDVKGIFVRFQKDAASGNMDLRARFDCPKSETNVINRLIAGRGESYVRWDVTEVAIF